MVLEMVVVRTRLFEGQIALRLLSIVRVVGAGAGRGDVYEDL